MPDSQLCLLCADSPATMRSANTFAKSASLTSTLKSTFCMLGNSGRQRYVCYKHIHVHMHVRILQIINDSRCNLTLG